MYTFVAFTDSVLAQIEEHVARFDPERGGALLGPVGQPVVTEFLYDKHASTSASTFTPSRWLEARVQDREAADPLIELKGILHSHPGAMSRPSAGDLIAYRNSLRGAPWLGRLIVPIVTVGTRPRGDQHVPLPSGIMSVYVAEPRNDTSGVVVEPAAPNVINVRRDLAMLATELGGIPGDPFILEVDGQAYLAGSVACEGFDLQFLFGPTYPFTAPVVLAARSPEASGPVSHERLGVLWDSENGPAVVALPISWNLEYPDETRLQEALMGPEPESTPAAQEELAPPQQLEAEADHDQETVSGDKEPTPATDEPTPDELTPEAAPTPWRVRVLDRAWHLLDPQNWRRPRRLGITAGRHRRQAALPDVPVTEPGDTDPAETELAAMEAGGTSND